MRKCGAKGPGLDGWERHDLASDPWGGMAAGQLFTPPSRADDACSLRQVTPGHTIRSRPAGIVRTVRQGKDDVSSSCACWDAVCRLSSRARRALQRARGGWLRLTAEVSGCTFTLMSRGILSTAESRRPVVAAAGVRVRARRLPRDDDRGRRAGGEDLPAYVSKLFPTKEKLFVAALESCFDQVVDALEKGADSAEPQSPTPSSTRWVVRMRSSSATGRCCSCRCTPNRSPTCRRSARRCGPG